MMINHNTLVQELGYHHLSWGVLAILNVNHGLNTIT